MKNQKVVLLCEDGISKSPRPTLNAYILGLLSYDVYSISHSLDDKAQKIIDIRGIKTINYYYSHIKTIKNYKENMQKALQAKDYQKIIHTENRAAIKEFLDEIKPDLILVENIMLAPIASEFAKDKKTKLAIDLREFYPLEYNHQSFLDGLSKVYHHILKTYVINFNIKFCINENIGNLYKKYFNFAPTIVQSLPFYYDLPISGPHTIPRAIYHGLISKDRHSMELLELAKRVEKVKFHFMILSNDINYFDKFLSKVVEINKNITHKIEIIKPVPLNLIIPFCNQFDIGLIALPPNSANNANATPNKLYEYINSNLAIASYKTKTIKKIVEKYKIGICSDFNTESLAIALEKLDLQSIKNYKINAKKASKILNVEQNIKIFKRTIVEN